MTLMERFRDLTPDKKKTLVWSVVGLVVLVIAVTGYNSRAKRIDIAAVKSNKVIHLDPEANGNK